MTEATIMSKPPTFLDKTQATSFISEMFALVPENLQNVASKALKEELDSGVHFSNEAIHDLIKSAIDVD